MNRIKAAVLIITMLLAGCQTLNDAPERGRVLNWSGQRWAVKDEPNPVGPGPNSFSGRKDHVYVDASGRLHLKIVKRHGRWMSTEIASFASYGYGTYTFEVEASAAEIPNNAVLGMFTYDPDTTDEHREVDLELSRWNDGRKENIQCALQPAEPADLVHHVPLTASPSGWTMSFRWAPGTVDCSVLTRENTPRAVMTHRFTRGVPSAGDTKVRLNLWLYKGTPPTTNAPSEVIVGSFHFKPL